MSLSVPGDPKRPQDKFLQSRPHLCYNSPTMNEIKPENDRNPVTHKIHRKEVFWQVSFPMILGCLLIIGLAVLTILGAARGGSLRQSADASLVFLILPTMMMAIFPLIILAGLAYGVIMLNQKLPSYMRQFQDAMIRVRDGVRTGADKAVEPVLRFKSKVASLEAFKRK